MELHLIEKIKPYCIRFNKNDPTWGYRMDLTEEHSRTCRITLDTFVIKNTKEAVKETPPLKYQHVLCKGALRMLKRKVSTFDDDDENKSMRLDQLILDTDSNTREREQCIKEIESRSIYVTQCLPEYRERYLNRIEYLKIQCEIYNYYIQCCLKEFDTINVVV